MPPLFDYKCPRCNKMIEILKSMNDNTPEYCSDDECKDIQEFKGIKIALDRQLSAPAGRVIGGVDRRMLGVTKK